jgi:hypothetical protein
MGSASGFRPVLLRFLGDPLRERERRLKLLDPTLRPIVKEINRQQAAGDDMHYSMHIYREIRWRLNFTPDIATTGARISDLRQSLTQPVEQKMAGEQQASDGTWGLGLMCGTSSSIIPSIMPMSAARLRDTRFPFWIG